jgi:hypothetical protein
MKQSKYPSLPCLMRASLLPALAILFSFMLSGSASAQPLAGKATVHVSPSSDDTPAIPEFDGIIDDLSAAFSLHGPEKYWREEAQGYQNHSWWTRNNATGVENTARWTLSLPDPGSYDLYAYIPASHASTRQANYLIVNNGEITKIQVDQFAHRNSWYLLGTFVFNTVENAYIELSDETGEQDSQFEIAFDAVGYAQHTSQLQDQIADKITDKIWGRAQPWLNEQSEKLQSRLSDWLQQQKGKLLRKLAETVTGWIDQQCAGMGAAMLLPLFALIFWRKGRSKP